MVDAGSAGATTVNGLRRFIADKAKTRVLAFLNIAAHGLAAAGCSTCFFFGIIYVPGFASMAR